MQNIPMGKGFVNKLGGGKLNIMILYF